MGTVLVDDGIALCDAPRWQNGLWWFSDLYGGAVHTVTPDGRRTTVLNVDGGPAGLAFLDDGSWIVASQRDQKLLRVTASGEVDAYADLAGIAVGQLNDMVRDAHGRIYVGCFGFDLAAGEEFRPAPLIRVDPGGTIRIVADGLRFPNAMALDESGRTLYLAETEGHGIVAFDVGDDGDLSGRRVWADLGDVRPDGLCLDAEGAVWIGGIDACAFLRVAEGGAVLDRIDTGDRWAIAPMLGGEDRRQLLMTTTRPVDPSDLSGDFIGRIEVTEVAVPGSGRP